jgi:hypothetical protein
MRLLRLADVETTPSDHVYYRSRAQALLFVAIAIFGAAVLAFRAFTAGFHLGYYLAAVDISFLALYRRFITARFRPSNWLVRTNNLGLFIQFRSYLNYHLPAEDLTVVFIAYQEIRSARLVREHVSTPDNEGGSSTQTLRYIELELGDDAGPLTNALQAESAERAPKEKRWYGSSSTLYEDHPVRMPSPPFLQIRWQAAPRAQVLLEALRLYTNISDPVLIKQDFTHLQGLSREDQQKRLRELAERGETIVAIYTARKLYGCGLSEAKEMVEGLRGQKSAVD